MQTTTPAGLGDLHDASVASSNRPFDAPLLTLTDLATVLSRTPAGLRATLHGHSEFSEALKGARLKLGRRIYFRTDLVKQIIAEATGR